MAPPRFHLPRHALQCFGSSRSVVRQALPPHTTRRALKVLAAMDAVSEAIDYAELQVACGLTDPESRREGMRMVFEAVKASPPVNFVQASVVLTKLMDSSLGASDRVSIAAAVNKKVVVHAPPVELRKQDVVAPPPNEPSPSGAAKPPPAPAAAQPTVAQTAAQTAPRPDAASLAAPDKLLLALRRLPGRLARSTKGPWRHFPSPTAARRRRAARAQTCRSCSRPRGDRCGMSEVYCELCRLASKVETTSYLSEQGGCLRIVLQNR